MAQHKLTDFEKKGSWDHHRALIMKWIRKHPGLTYPQLRHRFDAELGYVPEVGPRVRELKKIGWVKLVEELDGRKHIYPIQHVNHGET